MSKPDLFIDSSALFPMLTSAKGASNALLSLAEANAIKMTISEQVVVETERAIARKLPRALPYYREALRKTGVRIVPKPTAEAIKPYEGIIADPTDVPIVVAAIQARVDYLVTFNRHHFLDDPGVAQRAGIPMGLPADALDWVRNNLASGPKDRNPA
jgi:predicted nucleic acid-binding protein